MSIAKVLSRTRQLNAGLLGKKAIIGRYQGRLREVNKEIKLNKQALADLDSRQLVQQERDKQALLSLSGPRLTRAANLQRSIINEKKSSLSQQLSSARRVLNENLLKNLQVQRELSQEINANSLSKLLTEVKYNDNRSLLLRLKADKVEDELIEQFTILKRVNESSSSSCEQLEGKDLNNFPNLENLLVKELNTFVRLYLMSELKPTTNWQNKQLLQVVEASQNCVDCELLGGDAKAQISTFGDLVDIRVITPNAKLYRQFNKVKRDIELALKNEGINLKGLNVQRTF
jgi:hypothetical protein